MRPSRSTRSAFVAVVALWGSTVGWTQAVAAQPPGDPTVPSVTVTVESVSPWVRADGSWAATLRVAGAPEGAEITYSIRQPPTGTEAEVRDALLESAEGTDEPKVMQRSVTTDLASVTGADGAAGLEIPIRSGRTGDRDRTLIPNSGVYPVVVTIAAADGTELGGTTLYLNRLPIDDDDRPRPFRLGVIVRQPRLGGFGDDGDDDITAGIRDGVDATTAVLDEADGLPVQADLSPESIVALTQSETAGDLESVERLRTELGSASVLRVPWADLHVEGWATTGTLPEVQTSLIDGQEALFARLQRPVDARVWPVDPSVGPNGVEMLTRLGVESLLVETSQLTDPAPPASESGFTRPFRIAGAGGSGLAGVALDPALQDLLDTATDDPALSAHRLVTLLVGSWLSDSQERGSVVSIGPDAETEVTAALLGLLDGTSEPDTPIDVVDPADVAALPPVTVRQGGRDVPWTVELVTPAATPRVGAVASRLRTARALVDDYAAILPAGDAVAAGHAIVIQRSLDRRLTPGVQADLLDQSVAAMLADLDKITASGPASLTVTSRITSVPLRFTNDTGRPVKVRLRLQSPRLVFTDGAEQTLTLAPGLTRLDVRVDVRASGQFVMEADVLAPDSDRVLATTRQRIRSRAFSGVGLMLSGGALLFLVIWWSRTLRHRDRGDDTDDRGDDRGDPSGSGADTDRTVTTASEGELPDAPGVTTSPG